MGSRHDRGGMLFGGIVVTGIGVFFLLEKLELIPSIAEIWPVFPIIVGVAMIISSFARTGRPAGD